MSIHIEEVAKIFDEVYGARYTTKRSEKQKELFKRLDEYIIKKENEAKDMIWKMKQKIEKSCIIDDKK